MEPKGSLLFGPNPEPDESSPHPFSFRRIHLTFWRWNYFFLILAHPVYKMWIIQEPNKLLLWNKLHFEEKKT
jgi:hypothetical protein